MSKSITVPAKREELPHVLDFVEKALAAYDCPPKVQIQISIAVEEIFVNIASYAYGAENGEATVSVDMCDPPRSVCIQFQDSGQPYNPLERPDPDITLGAEERDVGGLGIFMVKKSMDGMEYENRNGRNILTIRKNLC